jgi:hypothetical protein
MPNPDIDRSAARKQERARRVAAAMHSVALSGGQISDATRADLADYAAGVIDGAELDARVLCRYGAV